MAQVVTQTLANNRGLKISGYTLRLAEFQVPISKSIYDTLVSGSAQYQKNEIQSLSGGKSESRSRSGALSLAQLVPTGATVTASYDAIWNANQYFNTVITGIDPVTNEFRSTTVAGTQHSYTQDLMLGVTQPLLRGFGPTVTNAPIVVAQLERVGAAADFQTGLESTLAGSLTTYWQLIGAIETYKCASSVTRRRWTFARQPGQVRGRRAGARGRGPGRGGRGKPARAAHRRPSGRARLRGPDQAPDIPGADAPQWPLQTPATQKFAWRETNVDLDETLKVAQAERPELRRAHSNSEQAQVTERVARNRLLPQLDLFANASVNGTDHSYGSSGSNMLDGDYNSYAAGLSLSYPLQNRAARYGYAQARVLTAQANESFKDAGDQITLEVRRAVRKPAHRARAHRVTAAQVRAEERKVQDERLRYKSAPRPPSKF